MIHNSILGTIKVAISEGKNTHTFMHSMRYDRNRTMRKCCKCVTSLWLSS